MYFHASTGTIHLTCCLKHLNIYLFFNFRCISTPALKRQYYSKNGQQQVGKVRIIALKTPRDKRVGNVGSGYLVDNEEIFVHS